MKKEVYNYRVCRFLCVGGERESCHLLQKIVPSNALIMVNILGTDANRSSSNSNHLISNFVLVGVNVIMHFSCFIYKMRLVLLDRSRV